MIENNSNKIPYPYEKSQSEDEVTEGTVGNDEKYQKVERDFKNAIAEVFSKTPIPKLFLILSMAIYAVVVFSKGNKGVDVNDLSSFIFFIIFIIFIFCILTIFAHIHKYFIGKMKKTDDCFMKNLKKYLSKDVITMIIFLIIVLLAVLLEFPQKHLIKNFIEMFV